MKQVKGFWLPDGEEHLVSFLENGPEFAGGPSYQLHKLMAAMPYIKNFRTAIDIGGHCGLWSRPLAAMFGRVIAFEPVEAHAACFEKNLGEYENVWLYCWAVGEVAGPVSLHTGESSSGDTYVQAGGEHTANMIRLDDHPDDLADVDFMKLDCEGYEFFALKGAEQTIKRWWPTIIVEQKPGKGKQFGLGDHDAVTLLKGWGYEQVKEISGDFIMRRR